MSLPSFVANLFSTPKILSRAPTDDQIITPQLSNPKYGGQDGKIIKDREKRAQKLHTVEEEEEDIRHPYTHVSYGDAGCRSIETPETFH